MSFGILELTLTQFLMEHVQVKHQKKMLNETFHGRVERLRGLLEKQPEMIARQAQWSHLIDQLEIVRDLRNRVAHSTLTNTLAADGKTIRQVLTLTKDATVWKSDAEEITFEELLSQNQLLADAVGELIDLDGNYSAPETYEVIGR